MNNLVYSISYILLEQKLYRLCEVQIEQMSIHCLVTFLGLITCVRPVTYFSNEFNTFSVKPCLCILYNNSSLFIVSKVLLKCRKTTYILMNNMLHLPYLNKTRKTCCCSNLQSTLLYQKFSYGGLVTILFESSCKILATKTIDKRPICKLYIWHF